MRLLHTSSAQLKEFIANPPPYAILSHTWGDEEVLFADLQGDPTLKTGWAKVTGACRVAKDLGYQWIWIDTCCIDKSSSAELSEAINSMFRWYEESEICLAYLADVHLDSSQSIDDFRGSRWFTRGWTLQELLAPMDLCFYSSSWVNIGPRHNFVREISLVTGIDTKYLKSRTSHSKYLKSGISHYTNPVFLASVAERMSWASLRETTRVEDISYCLLGIFNVNMSLIYGEGNNAFKRLQEAILQTANDHSILAWGPLEVAPPGILFGTWRFLKREFLLAQHPKAFQKSGNIAPCWTNQIETRIRLDHNGVTIDSPVLETWSRTEHGLLIRLVPLLCCQKDEPLNCIALVDLSRIAPRSTKLKGSLPVTCDRLMGILCSVPKRTWAPEKLLPVFLSYKQHTLGGELNFFTGFKCILRTIPRSYQVQQWLCSNTLYSPETDLEKPVVIRIAPNLIKSREAFCKGPGIGTLVMIRLVRRFSFDLVLVMQVINFNTTGLSEWPQASPSFPTYLVHCLASVHDKISWTDVGRRVGMDIKQAVQLIQTSEVAKSQGVAIDMATLLQPGGSHESGYTLCTDIRVIVSMDPSIDPRAFIVDIEDLTAPNKSYEANIENYMPVAFSERGRRLE